MHLKTDEEILHDCYMILGQKYASKKSKVELSKDKTLISGIASSTSLTLMRLTSDDIVRTTTDIQKYIITAKGLFAQYSMVRGRNPSCISSSLAQNMDKLITAVCRHEADMIGLLRLQETGGERIDIQRVSSCSLTIFSDI